MSCQWLGLGGLFGQMYMMHGFSSKHPMISICEPNLMMVPFLTNGHERADNSACVCMHVRVHFKEYLAGLDTLILLSSFV